MSAETQVRLGDCLDVMGQMAAKSVHLVYLDPPFFTQKSHTLVTRDRQREFSFDDVWASHTEYAHFLYERLQAIGRVLHPTGALFFHCDRNASHIVRILLDEVFGPENFRSEIIWHYRRWSNAQKNLLPAHQTIFYYTRSAEYTFHPQYGAYSAATNVDQIWQRRRRDEDGKSVYALDANGEAIPNGAKKGVPLGDVWDIPYLNPKATERTGYPTQKPVLLLEQIIKLASNENDLILDPFCGSGTTLVAAALLGRRAIGIDVSEDAVEIARQRLENPSKSESVLLQVGRAAYRNADEDALALLQGMDVVPVQRNRGIDAFVKGDIDGYPIPIRVQRPNETILEAAALLHRAGSTKNAPLMILVALRAGGYFAFADELPPGVVVVEGPGLAIGKVVDEFVRRQHNDKYEYDIRT